MTVCSFPIHDTACTSGMLPQLWHVALGNLLLTKSFTRATKAGACLTPASNLHSSSMLLEWLECVAWTRGKIAPYFRGLRAHALEDIDYLLHLRHRHVLKSALRRRRREVEVADALPPVLVHRVVAAIDDEQSVRPAVCTTATTQR